MNWSEDEPEARKERLREKKYNDRMAVRDDFVMDLSTYDLRRTLNLPCALRNIDFSNSMSQSESFSGNHISGKMEILEDAESETAAEHFADIISDLKVKAKELKMAKHQGILRECRIQCHR
ncbi:hypothetical protein B9Z55_028179 [Caenorhabditis nigoni]|uniref:Uncharacterized protein n=1 Tax=Caenorhabditis nigoni TaxID=1611254 RepID=A0A2G5SD14_9PELO|nr:hypothetical protein B9Z55_028179 [Caenorhabditis nigoni]